MAIQSYQDLIVWKKSIQLVKEIYKVTGYFPSYEMFGLTSQIRRAAISVASNIAEGFGRSSYKDRAQFFTIAYGSILEVETQTIIARELKFLNEKQYVELKGLIKEVASLLNNLKSKTKSFI